MKCSALPAGSRPQALATHTSMQAPLLLRSLAPSVPKLAQPAGTPLVHSSLPCYRKSRSCSHLASASSTAPGSTTMKPQPLLTNFIQSKEEYDALYARSIADPASFWGDVAEQFHWEKKWDPDHHSFNFDVTKGPINVEWFKGGFTNICYNALDRHVMTGHGNQHCMLFEGNEPGSDGAMTYTQVLDEVCRLANWMKAQGIGKGDCVAIYMPMVMQLPIAMLACARIGAVHSVVFGGFSADALAGRMEDCKARVLLTCNGGMRATKKIELKQIADQAIEMCASRGHTVDSVLVFANHKDGVAGAEAAGTPFTQGRDAWWQPTLAEFPALCDVAWVPAEHPLFLLYTSGSTGKPKGVLHTTGGYMVYAATTTKHAFQLQPGDVFWCTADCGWITGHSYLAYGPLLNRAVSVVFEGVPTHPTPARSWEIIDKYQVKQFYTAPTALRSLMRSGDEWLSSTSRQSLQVLGTVGEPINPEAWHWFHDLVGNGRCPVVDTWWQTETGGHMILPLPRAWPAKPGSATLPFFGVEPVILDDKGVELQGECEGLLMMRRPWPSTLRSVYGDHKRYEENYFGPYPGYYFTGDGARRDKDGYYWITGRVDDVINVSGHRIGTAEVESAIAAHHDCAEAAVAGYEHPVKGQGIYAFVVLKEGVVPNDQLKKEMWTNVRTTIGAFAAPDVIHWAPGLPKTRSGKIMRRVLRKIAGGQENELGDTSTLADPSIVRQLIETRN
uniref:Acetyl-coenzyme A synthetase n=1 Tax=Dunaliella tertiolecta TaxID=3047 RepID=A0A144QFN1_DUNTE|nr:acetyl-CoA synthetase [Dunaliella tertiolecta]